MYVKISFNDNFNCTKIPNKVSLSNIYLEELYKASEPYTFQVTLSIWYKLKFSFVMWAYLAENNMVSSSEGHHGTNYLKNFFRMNKHSFNNLKSLTVFFSFVANCKNMLQGSDFHQIHELKVKLLEVNQA